MGEVRVGDYLIDAHGKPTRVVAATEVLHGRPCYEVEFSDGSVIIADENHQWLTWTRPDAPVPPPSVVTTGQIAGAPLPARGRHHARGRTCLPEHRRTRAGGSSPTYGRCSRGRSVASRWTTRTSCTSPAAA